MEPRLQVGDGHRIAWQVDGDPAAPAVVLLHGGPGSGRSASMARWFDPAAWRVIQFDQRNCGRSEPHASAPSIDLSANTTTHLIADIEHLRERLGIERWVVAGASWGTTLGLAYAEANHERIAGLLLVSVVATTRAEVDWVTRSMGRVFPEEWQRFRTAAGVVAADDDLCAAYSRLLHDPDPDVRERAATAWCEWEDTHVATTPGHRHDPRYDDPAFRLCFARLVTHYWSHAAFLPDGQILREADRLAGIPGFLIHGRLDISGPPDVPWRLAQLWRDAALTLVDDAGHGGGEPSMRDAIAHAVAALAPAR